MESTKERPWYTVEEFAAYWGLSRKTAYRLVTLGQVPSVRVGRKIRIPPEALRLEESAEPTP